MSRVVFCSKLQKELAGLEKPPFSGAIGEEIFQKVSAQAWLSWKDDMMIKIINEYRLNMQEPEDYKTLINQMKAFLGLDKADGVLEVENADRGRKS